MKRSLLSVTLTVLFFSLAARAHEGGHGPVLNDQPREGGLSVQPIIDAKDSKVGPGAELVYKSELVPNSDGTFSLFVYDKDLNKVPMDNFMKSADGKIGPMKKNPKWKTESFTLEKRGDHFEGKLPQIKLKPYYLDITLTEGDRKLLTAYDNLDWSPKK